MKTGNYVPIIVSALALLVSGIVFFQKAETKKTAFIYNQVVFDGFEGRSALEQKLNLIKKQNKTILDSLAALVQAGRKELMPVYRERAELFFEQEKKLTDKYTHDVWDYLNSSIYQYGKTNQYDFILGTSGNGTLMYADSLHDVTQEVLKFVNEKYRGN